MVYRDMCLIKRPPVLYCNDCLVANFSGNNSREGTRLIMTACRGNDAVCRNCSSVPCSRSRMPKMPKQLLNLRYHIFYYGIKLCKNYTKNATLKTCMWRPMKNSILTKCWYCNNFNNDHMEIKNVSYIPFILILSYKINSIPLKLNCDPII